MMYMLDTCIIIYAMRHKDSPVYACVRNHAGSDICISSITYAELEYGIRKSSRPGQNRRFTHEMLIDIPILDFDAAAAEHFGDIFADLERRSMRIGDRDTFIAAHARSLGCTVVTHNLREFQRVRALAVADWLETPPPND